MSNSYYAETAFNSRSPRELPVSRLEKDTGTVQSLIRLNPITSRGLWCCEYLSYIELGFIDLLNDSSKQNLSAMRQPGHEEQEWASFKNPRAVVEVLRGIFAFFSWGAGVGSILIILITKFQFESFVFGAIAYLIPKSIFLILHMALKKNWVKDKNNIFRK